MNFLLKLLLKSIDVSRLELENMKNFKEKILSNNEDSLTMRKIDELKRSYLKEQIELKDTHNEIRILEEEQKNILLKIKTALKTKVRIYKTLNNQTNIFRSLKFGRKF